MIYRLLTAGLVLTLSGCLTATFAPTKSSYVVTSVTAPETIEVYRTEKPSKPYQEIGTVYVPSTILLKAITKLKEEAAKNGGNAIIDIKVTSDGIAGTVIKFD